MDKIHGYIYKTTNLVNGMIYIGQHAGEFKKYYLGSGDLIGTAVKKHGKENFSVKSLISSFSQKDLDETEIRLIRLHRKLLGRDRLYNIADGGSCVMRGRRHTEQSKLRMKESHKSRVNKNGDYKEHKSSYGMLGKHHSEESKLKISKSQIGKDCPWLHKPRSEETKNKIRASLLGRKGRPHTEEEKIQVGMSLKSRYYSNMGCA